MNGLKTTLIARFGLVVAFFIASLSPALAATFTPKHGISMELWVTWPGTDKWNDPEVLDNFPEWQKFVSDAELNELKQNGFTMVRLPIDPAMFLFSDDEKRAAKLLESVHTSINRILDAGLDVIVDLHTIPYAEDLVPIGIDQIQNDDLTFVNYKALVEKFAAELQKYDPENVALELINEPIYECDDSDTQKLWGAQLKQLHSAARAANPNVTLILTGACYGSATGLTLLDPNAFEDDNIIWSFHNYEPFILTHQSAGWAGKPVSAFKNLPYPPSELDAATIENMPKRNDDFINDTLSGRERSNAGWYIRNEFEAWGAPEKIREKLEEPFKLVVNWATENAIDPSNIFLGEFGFIAQEYNNDFKTNPDWRIAYIKDNIALADQYGFGWSMWSYSGAFGMAKGFGGEKMQGELLKRLELPNTN